MRVTSAGLVWPGRTTSDPAAAIRKRRRWCSTAPSIRLRTGASFSPSTRAPAKERWRWDPEVNQTAVFPKICCGVVNRGLAIYKNLIIAPIIDGRLEALNAETGKVGLGIARRVSAGQLHPHHGAAHRQGQSNHRRCRRRVSRARLLRRVRRQDRQVRLEVLHRSRRSVEALRERGDAEGRRDLERRSGGNTAAALPSGTAWPTIPRPTWFTSAPATPDRGPKSFVSPRARITSMSPRFLQ